MDLDAKQADKLVVSQSRPRCHSCRQMDASQALVWTFANHMFTSTPMLQEAFLALPGGVLTEEQTTSLQNLQYMLQRLVQANQ